MKKTLNLKKVDQKDLYLFYTLIRKDHTTKNNKEIALLITENFNVICTESDIKNFNVKQQEEERRFKFDEDFELESRKFQTFNSSW